MDVFPSTGLAVTFGAEGASKSPLPGGILSWRWPCVFIAAIPSLAFAPASADDAGVFATQEGADGGVGRVRVGVLEKQVSFLSEHAAAVQGESV